MKDNIIAVIVTRNRKKLLGECIGGLLTQKKRPNKIIIVDNNSSDGTELFLKNKFSKEKIIEYIKLEKNMGPAGGFYVGIKKAYEDGADWVWIMDDDSEPEKKCLEELVNAKNFLKEKKKKIGFLASCVYSPDGNIMNITKISDKISKITGEQVYPQYLDIGLVEVENATFVSVLYSREFISRKGYPIKDLFIWGDDTEYSRRASKEHVCYLVGKSRALHKKQAGKVITIFEEDRKDIIDLYRFFYRNNTYAIINYESRLYLLKILVNWIFIKPLRCIFYPPFRIRKARSIFFGTISGFFFNPKIEVPSN